MKLKTLLLPLTAFALCANAFAATPSDASLGVAANALAHNAKAVRGSNRVFNFIFLSF